MSSVVNNYISGYISVQKGSWGATMFRLTPWSLEALPVATGGLLLKLYSIQSLSLRGRSSPDVHLHNDTNVTENRAVFFFFLSPLCSSHDRLEFCHSLHLQTQIPSLYIRGHGEFGGGLSGFCCALLTGCTRAVSGGQTDLPRPWMRRAPLGRTPVRSSLGWGWGRVHVETHGHSMGVWDPVASSPSAAGTSFWSPSRAASSFTGRPTERQTDRCREGVSRLQHLPT